jgi:hypothetical protein
MSFFVSAPVQISVKGWALYDARATNAGRTGIFNIASVVNRFHARYKFARSFKGIQLEGYSVSTVNGYSALMRASLHWTAFELFKQAIHIKDTRDLIALYPFDSHLTAIRGCVSNKSFFNVIRGNLKDAKQRAQIEAFSKGEDISPLVLGKALRHIFLHGSLTPNAAGAAPNEVEIICEELCRYMVEVMDGEFEKKANKLVVAIG